MSQLCLTFISQCKVYCATCSAFFCKTLKQQIKTTAKIFISQSKSFMINNAPLFKVVIFNVALLSFALLDAVLFDVRLFKIALFDIPLFLCYTIYCSTITKLYY